MSKKLNITIILILSLIWLALPQGVCLGATYYVDAANGNDANPGTSELPWATLDRAYTWYSGPEELKVEEGDTVLFRDGSYGEFSEQVYVDRADWVTYRADTGHSPELTNIVIRNDGDPDGDSYLVFDGLTITGLTGAAAVKIAKAKKITVQNCTISCPGEAYEGEYAPYYKHDFEMGITARDVEYIIIRDNTITNGDYGVRLWNAVYCQVEGNMITSMGSDGIKLISGSPTNICSDIIIAGNTVRNQARYSTNVHVYGTSTGSWEEGETCTQANSGATGIVFEYYSSYLKVWENTSTHFDGSNNITGDSSSATLTNLSRVDVQHNDGIEFHQHDLKRIEITGNTVYSDESGLDNRWDHGILIQGSKYNVDDETYDIEDVCDIRIENNLVYGNVLKGFLIFGGREFYLNNNTYYSNRGDGWVHLSVNISNHGPYDVEIAEMFNNIFESFEQDFDLDGKTAKVIAHSNNIFGDDPGTDHPGGPATPFVVNGTELINYDIDSLFVDAANNDYRLVEGSVAIDFADPAYAPATDIDDNLRDAYPDAGCYEYITLQRPDRSEDKTEVKCYNNVFNPTKEEEALIWIELSRPARVKVDLYNTRGNRIRELADEERDAETCRYYWNGKDDNGNVVGSGLYFVHIQAGDYKKTKKIVVVK